VTDAESVLGWKELELEVVRDAKNQMSSPIFGERACQPRGLVDEPAAFRFRAGAILREAERLY